MKQIKVIKLILLLLKILITRGNALVFYHMCGRPDSFDYPMEVEGIAIRKPQYLEERVTIY